MEEQGHVIERKNHIQLHENWDGKIQSICRLMWHMSSKMVIQGSAPPLEEGWRKEAKLQIHCKLNFVNWLSGSNDIDF